MSELEELEAMAIDCQEKKLLLKDIFEEMEININRSRVIIKGQPKKVVEPIDNECIGDMQ